MVDHLTKIYETRDKLAAIGENVNDQHLAALMLCSLHSSYDGLITALEARDERDLSASFIRIKLIDEHTKRVENNRESENSHSALKVVTFNKKKQINFAAIVRKLHTTLTIVGP